jgi:creatinine amidohydrolase
MSDGISRPDQRRSGQVRWAELLPRELRERRAACPIAWLPLGLCEPHGYVAAFGLDTIKAVWLCDEGARRFGGVVAPTQGWHVHETGYHARWLEEVIGEEEAELGSLPPELLSKTFLFQLRALANAGFKGVLAVSGHAGGNQVDLRRVAGAFMARVPLKVEVYADPELVAGRFAGDHAGKFEISQLMALRPDLVDLSLLGAGEGPDGGGRFALGDDAAEATAEHGRLILEAQLGSLGDIMRRMTAKLPAVAAPRLGLSQAEEIWAAFVREPIPLVTANPALNQPPVSPGSKWKAGEHWTSPGTDKPRARD